MRLELNHLGLRRRLLRRTATLGFVAAVLAAVFASAAMAAAATTENGDSLSSSTAVLNGSFATEGKPTFYGFEWGTTTAYGHETDGEYAESGTVFAHREITGLAPGTTYHFRAVAASVTTGDLAYSYGADRTFTTQVPHARRFEAERYSASLGGQQNASNPLALTMGIRTVSCSSVKINGSLGGTSHSFEVGGEYSGCTATGGLPAIVAMNSCKYQLQLQGGTDSAAITCTKVGDAVEVKIYGSKAAQEEGKVLCLNTAGAQSLTGAVDIGTSGYGSGRGVSFDLNTSGIQYTITGSALSCGKSGSNGTLKGAGTVVGTDSEGKPNGVFVAGDPVVGLFLVGEGGNQPKFEAGSYPALIAGDQPSPGSAVLGLGIRKFTCSSIELSGTLSSASSELALAAAYGGNCAASGLPATMNMNSCSYVLQVANSGPPYTGVLQVACTKEGDAIEAKAYSSQKALEEGKAACVYAIAPQSVGGIGLETIGTGSDRSVAVNLGVNTLQYTLEGSPLVCGKAGSNGTYTGSLSLAGL